MTDYQRHDLEGCVDYEHEHSDDDTVENQRRYFVDHGKQPSDDDVPSCIEIPFDRVAPLKFSI